MGPREELARLRGVSASALPVIGAYERGEIILSRLGEEAGLGWEEASASWRRRASRCEPPAGRT